MKLLTVLFILAAVVVFVSAKPGAKCRFNNECVYVRRKEKEEYCNGFGICINRLAGDQCKTYVDCSKILSQGGSCINNKCTIGKPNGSACQHEDECKSKCIFGKCADRSGEGGPCQSKTDCIQNYNEDIFMCQNSKCVRPVKKKGGESCSQDIECEFHCDLGKCYIPNTAHTCVADVDCVDRGGNCCDGTCKAVC